MIGAVTGLLALVLILISIFVCFKVGDKDDRKATLIVLYIIAFILLIKLISC